jgi:hypothetical protein
MIQGNLAHCRLDITPFQPASHAKQKQNQASNDQARADSYERHYPSPLLFIRILSPKNEI